MHRLHVVMICRFDLGVLLGGAELQIFRPGLGG
jgi:hypothetical protein